MQFATPLYFFFLFIVPIVAVICAGALLLKRRRLRRFSAQPTLVKISLNHSVAKDILRCVLLLLALTFLIIALARPQWGEEQVEIRHKGIDVMFVLDASMSMLAEDVKPNRFIKARLLIDAFVRQMRGNRVGLVVFAGQSYLSCPLTVDHAAFRLFLNNTHIGSVAQQGTALGPAFKTAIRSFSSRSLKDKVIILLSDGEDHEGELADIVSLAKKHEFYIYCIGLGRKDGVPIPLKDEQGSVTGYKADAAGATVMTRLYEEPLYLLAEKSGGLYFPATAAEKEVDTIIRHLETLDRVEFESKLFKQKEEKYHIFIVVALLFLLSEVALGMRKSRFLMKFGVTCLLPFFFMGFSLSQFAELHEGNELYRVGKYQEAVDAYERARAKDPANAMVYYNQGSAYYQLGDYEKAREQFMKALEIAPEEEPIMKKVLYNLASAQYRNEELEGALKTFKAVLDIDDTDRDAKHNVEVIKKKLGSSSGESDKQVEDEQESQDSPEPNQEDNEGQNQSSGEGDSESDQQEDKEDDQDTESEGQGRGKPDEEEDDDEQDQSSDSAADSEEPEDAEDDSETEPDDSQEADSEREAGAGDGMPQEEDTKGEEPEEQEQEQQKNQQSEEQTEEREAPEPDQQQVDESTGGQLQHNQVSEASGRADGEVEEYFPKEAQDESSALSPEDAERILDALQESEQDLGAMRYSSSEEKESQLTGKDW